MTALWLVLLLGCQAETPPSGTGSVRPSEPVEVQGSVRGWDGTGDVAIEACGRGALVDEDNHRFGMWTASDCALRVVWERDAQRGEGAWHDLPAPDASGVVRVELPMPEELTALSPEERAYREAVIREAQRQLDGGEGGEEGGAVPEPGV